MTARHVDEVPHSGMGQIGEPEADAEAQREIHREYGVGRGPGRVRVPHGLVLVVRGPDEDIRAVELQEFAVEIVAVAHVAGVVDELAQDRIRGDAVRLPEILAWRVVRIGCGNAIDGLDIAFHVFLRNGVLDDQNSLFLEFFPLIRGETWRRHAVGILSHGSLSLQFRVS